MNKFSAVVALTACVFAAGAAMAQSVSIGVMSRGSLSFSAGGAIAEMLNEKTDAAARIIPNPGESNLIPRVNSGALDFGIANVFEAAQASTGTGAFEGRKQENLRIAAVIYPLRTAFFVRADSDMRSLADLRGKRVTAGFAAMGTISTVLDTILANGGLTLDDVTPLLVPNVVVGAELFASGEADAFYFAVGAPKVEEIDAETPLRMLPLDTSDEAVARMKAVLPLGYVAMTPGAAAMAGVDGSMPVLGYDNLLLTSSHAPDAKVLAMLDALAANTEQLASAFALFRGLEPKNFHKEGLVAPYHPATIAWAASKR